MKKIFYFKELNEIELETLGKICNKINLKKKEIFMRPGDINHNLLIIKKGMVRGFFYDEEGIEHTIFISEDTENNKAFGIPENIYLDVSSKYYFEAIEETELLVFNINEFEFVASQHQRIMCMYLTWLKNAITLLVFRLEVIATQKPCDRLNKLLEKCPQKVFRAKRKHIASFLGITPNSLSRITARLKKTKKLS